MMTDRERAELALLRDLLALRTGNAPEIAAAALHHLLIATDATLACLELGGRAGGFEGTATKLRLSREQIRARVVPTIVDEAHARQTPLVTMHRGRSIACTPIIAPEARGHLYLLTNGEFSSRDLSLVANSVREARDVAHLLVGQGDLRARIRAFEWRCVRDTLERCHGNVSAAARVLGVPRSFLYRVRGKDRRGSVSK